MAYHVGYDAETNNILAGTVNKKGDRWINKTIVNDECIAAVANHFLCIAVKENTNEAGYNWKLENGTVIRLTAKVFPPEEEQQQGEEQ